MLLSLHPGSRSRSRILTSSPDLSAASANPASFPSTMEAALASLTRKIRSRSHPLESPIPHLRFVHDSPESRAFDADRFRVVEESQDLLRMRGEDEEKRPDLAYSRYNVYRKDFDRNLARRKRLRWTEDTGQEEHLGGPSKSHLRVWDKEIDHARHVLLPGLSVIPTHAWSPRAPHHFVAIDGKREVVSVAEWQYLVATDEILF